MAAPENNELETEKAAPEKKRNIRSHRILFCLEMLLLLVFLGVLFLYGQVTSRLGKLSQTPSTADYQEQLSYDASRIRKNQTAPRITGYRTVALFGLDHRTMNEELSGENSDTIIICSIDNDTSDIKMVSVYRDTLLNIGDDIYTKANAAYAYGGPVQAVSMLNTNLDLNITDYVTVDFNAVVSLVDAVGGLDIPMSYAEIVHMNNYCVETSEETGKDYTPIELPDEEPEDLEEILGTYHLNGVQATSYCRIRYTANLDMGRTERQRRVIQMVADKLKKSGITRIFRIMDEVFPMITTSLSKTEILSLVPQMISYKVDDTTGFPLQFKFSNIKGSIIVADTLTQNVILLHDFLYGKDEKYEPSDNIWEISADIIDIVGGESELRESAPVVSADDIDKTYIWTHSDDENGSSGGSIWLSETSGWGSASDNSDSDHGDSSSSSGDASYGGRDTSYNAGTAAQDGGSSTGYSEPDEDDFSDHEDSYYEGPSYEYDDSDGGFFEYGSGGSDDELGDFSSGQEADGLSFQEAD